MVSFLRDVSFLSHQKKITNTDVGGGSNAIIFTLPGKMIHFDNNIFQMGWFNHQLVIGSLT